MIFILGGKGFVGSAFARLFELKREPFEIITRENFSKVEGKTCDIFINAAGNSKKWFTDKEPLNEFDQSVRLVRSTLENFTFETYVQLSSCDVYPDCSRFESTSEDAVLDPLKQSPYGFHKYLAELCVERFAPRWFIFRLGGMVGPMLKKNPLFDLLSKKHMHVSLDSKLQFMSTDDMARLAWEVLSKKSDSRKYNLCGNGVIALEEARKYAGFDAEPLRVPTVHYEVNITRVSQLVRIPSTRDTVFRFIDDWRACAG